MGLRSISHFNIGGAITKGLTFALIKDTGGWILPIKLGDIIGLTIVATVAYCGGVILKRGAFTYTCGSGGGADENPIKVYFFVSCSS